MFTKSSFRFEIKGKKQTIGDDNKFVVQRYFKPMRKSNEFRTGRPIIPFLHIRT